MRRSRNFLRYTNIRRRQKSERRGGDTQAKCPILPDNLRLHFFVFFFSPDGRKDLCGPRSLGRAGQEASSRSPQVESMLRRDGPGHPIPRRAIFLLPVRPSRGGVGGQKSTRSCVAGRGSASTAPSETNAHFPPSSSPPLAVRAEIGQRSLCLSCTGRARTNTGLLWTLISSAV